MDMKALYALPQSVEIGGHLSSLYYFVGSQADNPFYLDTHHTLATLPLPPSTQTQTTERGIPIRQTTPQGGSILLPPTGHHRSPTSPVSSAAPARLHSHTPTASLSPSSKQLSTSDSSSSGTHVRWNSAGANANGDGAGSVLSSEAGL